MNMSFVPINTTAEASDYPLLVYSAKAIPSINLPPRP